MSALEKNWAAVFHHMANPSSVGLPLVPETSEQQVVQLLATFEEKVCMPFAPGTGAHGLVFGEWGHGKSQVLYRVAAALGSRSDRCLALALVPESLTSAGILAAAAAAARKLGHDDSSLRAAITRVTNFGNSADASRVAAEALASWAAGIGRTHVALLFDEAQTLGGAEQYQQQLQELRSAFDRNQITLHTLQCHSMVSLDRARELGQALAWLQGPSVRHVYLSSLNETETKLLLRGRVADVLGESYAEKFFQRNWATTICRLVGGNPRKALLLSQSVAHAMFERGGDFVTGEDIVLAAAREAGPAPGSRLFSPERLQSICDLLPSSWPQRLGQAMANELSANIGYWFGESAAIDIAEVATRLGVSVAELGAHVRRPVAGIELFSVLTDTVLELTTLQLSGAFLDYVSAAFRHAGGVDDKQAQFKLLLAASKMQREVADALRSPIGQAQSWEAFESATFPTPVPLESDSGGNPIRGYRAQVRRIGAPEYINVLIAPVLGKTSWPSAVRNAIEKRIREQNIVRAVLLDFVVDEDVIDEPWPSQPVEKSRIVRIDYRKWADLIVDAGPSEGDSLSVKSAQICAALLGHSAALASTREPDEGQKKTVGDVLGLIAESLPTASEFTYLPNAQQRSILDSPGWNGEGHMSLKAMGEGVTTATVAHLQPHYLIRDGARWRRLALLRGPLANLMRDFLKKAQGPLGEQEFADAARDTLLLAQAEELGPCVVWILEKFIEAGEAERRLDGYVFINLEADNKTLRKDLLQLRRTIQEDLQRLKLLRRERWMSMQDKFQRIPQDFELSGRALYDALLSLRSDLESLKGEIELSARLADQEISELITDARTRAASMENRTSKAHAVWRDILAIEARFGEVLLAVADLQQAQGSDSVDKYGAVRDAHATFEGRYRGLEKLFKPDAHSPPREQVAGLGLGIPFQSATVHYRVNSQ